MLSSVYSTTDIRNSSLRVPRYGALLEFLNFALLFTTYMLCMTHRDLEHLHAFEVVFMVFALAFALDEYTASIEHGWKSKCSDVCSLQ